MHPTFETHSGVQDELGLLEKAEIISGSVFPCSSPVVIVLKKAQAGNNLKNNYVAYHTLNSILLPVGKAHSTEPMVPLPKIVKLLNMLDESTAYF